MDSKKTTKKTPSFEDFAMEQISSTDMSAYMAPQELSLDSPAPEAPSAKPQPGGGAARRERGPRPARGARTSVAESPRVPKVRGGAQAVTSLRATVAFVSRLKLFQFVYLRAEGRSLPLTRIVESVEDGGLRSLSEKAYAEWRRLVEER